MRFWIGLLILLGSASGLEAQPRGLSSRTPPLTLDGVVDRYLLAPRGEIDGVLLRDGTSVRLAPHLSASLAQSIKTGDSVRVVSDRPIPLPTPQGRGVKAVSIENRKSRLKISSEIPEEIPVQGNVVRLLFDASGDVDGVLLDDGIQVRFPVPVGEALVYRFRQLKKGEAAKFETTGPLMRNRFGRVVDAGPISFNGDPLDAFGASPPPSLAPAPGGKRASLGPRRRR